MPKNTVKKQKEKASAGKEWQDPKTIPDSPARSTRSQSKGIPVLDEERKLPAKKDSPNKRKAQTITETPDSNNSNTVTLNYAASAAQKPKTRQQNLNKSNWGEANAPEVETETVTIQAKVASTNTNANQMAMTDTTAQTSHVRIRGSEDYVSPEAEEKIAGSFQRFMKTVRRGSPKATQQNVQKKLPFTQPSPTKLPFAQSPNTAAAMDFARTMNLSDKNDNEESQYKSLSPTGSVGSRSPQQTKFLDKIDHEKKSKGNNCVYAALSGKELLHATSFIRRDLFRRAKFAPEYLLTKMVTEVLESIGISDENADAKKVVACMSLTRASINSRRSYAIRNITSQLRCKYILTCLFLQIILLNFLFSSLCSW